MSRRALFICRRYDKAKLYVGHLAPHTTREMLEPLFARHGRIMQIDIIPDRERMAACKGFAFVLMEDEAQARAAAYAVNGLNFESRCIEVGLGGSGPRFLS